MSWTFNPFIGNLDYYGNDRVYATKVVAASDSLAGSKADYVCDGTNDEVEIQAAVSAMPANGGNIFLLEGQFNISSQILISSVSKINIIGVGNGTQLVTTACSAFVLSGATNIFISNIYFSSTNKTTSTNISIQIYNTSSGNNITNCLFSSIYQGIAISTNSNNNLIISNEFTDIYHTGIYSATTSYSNRISFNYIHDSSSSYGIQVYDSSNYTIISNNLISNIGWYGVYFSNVTYCEVMNNIISECESGGLALYLSSYCEIVGNLIRNNATITSDVCGINLNNCLRNNISGNICIDTRSPAKQDYGIYETGTKNLIVNNICYGNNKEQIHVAGTGTMLSHNIED